jgi:VCBS repeat-containing protein
LGATSTTTTLTVTIHGTNDAPHAVNDAASATEAGGVNNTTPGVNPSGNVLAKDTDVDSGDTKAVTTTGTFSGAHGTISLAADGSCTYTVNNSDAAVDALRLSTDTLTDSSSYTMKDMAGATSTATLTITIQGANDAPHAKTAPPAPSPGRMARYRWQRTGVTLTLSTTAMPLSMLCGYPPVP